MPKPSDPAKYPYMFSDDFKFTQKAVIIHPKEKNKMLILRRSQSIHSRPGDWDFPGGNVLYGEHHEASLLREIKEEAGLNVTKLRPITVTSSYHEKENVYSLFIQYVAHATSDRVSLSHEHTEYTWVTLEEFLSIDTAAFLHEAAKIALSAQFLP